MKLITVRANFEYFSGKASDLARQLALAGIAIVWIFKVESKTGLVLPKIYHLPLGLFCTGLFADLLQYVYATVIWAGTMTFSGKTQDDDHVKVWSWINVPTWTFFTLKMLAFLIAYVLLLHILITQILSSPG